MADEHKSLWQKAVLAGNYEEARKELRMRHGLTYREAYDTVETYIEGIVESRRKQARIDGEVVI